MKGLPSLAERYFEARVLKTESCWLWTGAITSQGYGTAFVKPFDRILAHRLSLRLSGRKVPFGLVVDHTCRVRRCVNPAHLDIVTSGENVLRGNGAPARNAKRTHCRFGHPYSYVQTTNGQRMCRICNTAYKRFVRAMEREALEKQRKAVEALAAREKA